MSRKDGKSNLVGGEEKRGGIFIADVENEEYDSNLQASENCAAKIITIEKIK